MTVEPFVTQDLAGWGRFPVERCHLFRPERRDAVPAILASGGQPSYVARGLGRSYGDAALNAGAGVIGYERLNRFIAFDPESGVLECEAGASLAEIIQHFLPRGYFLPVTPGTKFVTVGGAIAADVHGKNHHRDGTIARFVQEFTLLTPGGEVLTCSPDRNEDVFWATAGGMGLTGVILTAKVRLRPVETAYVLVDYQKARNLEEALGLFAESDEQYQYSVAWIDCLARGAAMGRAVLMRGNHAPAAALPRGVRDPLALPGKGWRAVPVELPSGLLNRFTVGAFNAVYYGRHRDVRGEVVDLETFFYPLDSVHHWNRMYGRRGFVQYQVALPPAAGPRGLAELLRRLAGSRRASFLAVLKRFGPANPGLLSFPMEGYTLALDLPVGPGLVPFLHELDRVVLEHGGRVYLAKDAVLTPETFAAMYPNLERFREIKRRLDPQGLLSSSMARRLGMVAGEGVPSGAAGARREA
ncbi:MAG TPA: FAD-binding oxidoreductase [Dehalococcoidia bacterium]